MIDEALYQQAADELNSDKRRAHIWARACALANDDHDEARYLYTNLRVEELLAERTRGASEPVRLARPGDATEELELEPFDPPSPDAPSDAEPPASVSAGYGTASAPLPGARDEGTRRRPESERGRVTLDPEEGWTADLDPDALVRHNEADGTGVSAIHGGPRDESVSAEHASAAADGPDESGASLDWDAPREDEASGDGNDDMPADIAIIPPDPRTPFDSRLEALSARREDREDDRGDTEDDHDGARDDTLDWLDEGIDRNAGRRDGTRRDAGDPDAGMPPPPSRGDDMPAEALLPQRRSRAQEPERDALTRELERQAEEMPGANGAARVIEHEPPATRAYAAASASGAGAGIASADASATFPDEGTRLGADDAPLELVDGDADEEFAVFARPGGRAQAVRQGSSWAALLLTLPWLLYRHLIGTAIVYTLLAAVVLGGLTLSGLAWLDAGAATALPTRIACIAFALLAALGLFVVPFRQGNHWREDKLERRGFELIAYVRTRSAERAIALAREASGGGT